MNKCKHNWHLLEHDAEVILCGYNSGDVFHYYVCDKCGYTKRVLCNGLLNEENTK